MPLGIVLSIAALSKQSYWTEPPKLATEEAPERTPEELRKERERRDRAYDKTLEDSFPTSDAPSTIPNPGEEKEDAA